MLSAKGKRNLGTAGLLLLGCFASSCWWSATPAQLALRLRIERPPAARDVASGRAPAFGALGCFFVNITSAESPPFGFQFVPSQANASACPRLSQVSPLVPVPAATTDGIGMRVLAGRKRLIQVFAVVPASGGGTDAGCGGKATLESLFASGTPKVYLMGSRETDLFRDGTLHVPNTYDATKASDLASDCKLVATGPDGLVPPTSVTYTPSSWVLTVGQAATVGPPTTTGGAPTAFDYVPKPLPAGLSLDTATGIISGTPTSSASPASYTITASNDAGSAQTTVSLSVSAASQSSQMPVTDGTVRALAVYGTQVFLGGDFLHAGPRRGSGALVNDTTGDELAGSPSPFVDGPVYAAALDGNGGFFIGGEFQNVAGKPRPYLAHIKPDGSLDTQFGALPDDKVRALHVDGTTLYVGGDFSTMSGLSRRRLAAVSADTGGVVTSFLDPGLNGSVYAITHDATNVYVGGSFSTSSRPNLGSRKGLASFTKADGSLTAFCSNTGATGGSVPVRALAFDSGGKLYAGGDFTAVASSPVKYFAQIDTSNCAGNVSFDLSLDAPVRALYSTGNGIYVGGDFTKSGTDTGKAHLLRTGAGSIPTLLNWNPGIDGSVHAIAPFGSSLFIGGSFLHANGALRPHAAIVDTANSPYTWTQTFNDDVDAIAGYVGTVFMGGQFTGYSMPSRTYLAAIDLSTKALTSWAPVVDQPVRAMSVNGTKLYIGGDFSTINSNARLHLAAYDLSTGALDLTWTPSTNNTVEALQAYTNGSGITMIYAGGNFTQASDGLGPKARSGAASFDASGIVSSWDPNPFLLPSGGGDVRALAINGSTSVYVGGNFTRINGSTGVTFVARVDQSNGTADSYAPSLDGPVNTIAVDSSTGAVYLGGMFTQVGSNPRSRLAKTNSSGGLDMTWNPSASGSAPVVDALLLDTLQLWVGGLFSVVGGKTRANFSGVDNSLGSALGAVVPNPDGEVYAVVRTVNTLVLGGAFKQAAGIHSPGVIAVSAADGSPL